MRRLARAERVCRRCPFRGPSGECRDPARKSGHCGDWIWWMRNGKQIRRLYVYPHDPRSPAQLRSRASFGDASRKYSDSLTEKQRRACIAAGAKLRSRPRLGQSGPLTGHQYSIHRHYALQKAHGNAIKEAFAPQVRQLQRLNTTSSDRHRSASMVPPQPHQRDARLGRKNQQGETKRSYRDTKRAKATQPLQTRQKQRLGRPLRKRRLGRLPLRRSPASTPRSGKPLARTG
jgi:hypothetical protein